MQGPADRQAGGQCMHLATRRTTGGDCAGGLLLCKPALLHNVRNLSFEERAITWKLRWIAARASTGNEGTPAPGNIYRRPVRNDEKLFRTRWASKEITLVSNHIIPPFEGIN